MILARLVAFALCVLVPTAARPFDRSEVYRSAKSATALVVGLDERSHSVSFGSGFFVDSQGLLLTNAHVIEDSSKIVVYVCDQAIEANPEIRAVDKDLDLAALRIGVRGGHALNLDPDAIEDGMDVIAVGYPRISDILQIGFTLHPTVLPATVSGTAYGRFGAKGRLTPFIQTTGMINFGNSGGPLVRTGTGDVVGMMTTTVPYLERARDTSGSSVGSGMMKAGISYSIPAQVIREWLAANRLQPISPRSRPSATACHGEASEADRSFATGHLLHTMALTLNEDADLIKLAIRHYEIARSGYPHADWIVRSLARAHASLGEWEHILRTYEKEIDRFAGDVGAMIDLGVSSHRLGRVDRAEEWYRAAIRIDPEYWLAHNNLANLLRETGRHDDAIMEYRRARMSAPGSAVVALNLGVALEAQGQPDEAISLWESFLTSPRQVSQEEGIVRQIRDSVARLKMQQPALPSQVNLVSTPLK